MKTILKFLGVTLLILFEVAVSLIALPFGFLLYVARRALAVAEALDKLEDLVDV